MSLAAPVTRRSIVAAGLTLGGGLASADARSSAAQDAATPAATPLTPSGTQPDGSWVFTDDLGVEIRLPSAPVRVVAELSAAAAL